MANWKVMLDRMLSSKPSFTQITTADGSEIRRAPVEVGSFSHYLQGFIHPRWLFGICEASTV